MHQMVIFPSSPTHEGGTERLGKSKAETLGKKPVVFLYVDFP
jgi:hypothetical protein